MNVAAELPPWATTLRPQQVTAIAEILDGFARGMDVMILDGPTGSGKSLIGRVVGQRLGVPSTYIAHSLSLQDQFMADFPEAQVLKGRANYPTLDRPDRTTADCTGIGCHYCTPTLDCPYLVAKTNARHAEVAVLNTSYFLAFQSSMFVRPLMVLDEADTLEDIILGQMEFYLSRRHLAALGLNAPLKGAHLKSIRAWINGVVLPVAKEQTLALNKEAKAMRDAKIAPDRAFTREHDRAKRFYESVSRLNRDLDAGRSWIREYVGSGDFLMKPVQVNEQGADLVWKRGRKSKWLAMSASIIDAGEWAETVGVEAAGLKWGLVTLPNVWPQANRPLVGRTWGDMSKKGSEEGKRRVIARCVEICQTHLDHGENVLVHAVSYWLSGEIVTALQHAGITAWTYENARQRDSALRQFKGTGGVIVAPSLDRGVDLPDDLCRAVVVAKVPYPNLGERRVAARMHLPDGDRWYATHTARTLLQMTGRGIRHADDRCVTYILDSSYDGFYWKWSRLLPRWWRNSTVDTLPEDWWKR